jgi:hypothetical protein
MIYIPPKVKISSTIKPGSAYYFIGTNFQSTEPHYFVILNKDPLSSMSLIVVNATSKVSKREAYITSRNLPTETLVKVTRAECSFLKIDSAFDCNYPGEYTPQELIDCCNTSVFEYKGDVSDAILKKLQKGLLASPLVKKESKKLV